MTRGFWIENSQGHAACNDGQHDGPVRCHRRAGGSSPAAGIVALWGGKRARAGSSSKDQGLSYDFLPSAFTGARVYAVPGRTGGKFRGEIVDQLAGRLDLDNLASAMELPRKGGR
jgi:hypothetical protein